ncbi:MAG: class IV adenylate cyclase [Desulfobacterales bacterium]|nr:class IV adenylate cyclase [Desulfobacterales bacterium]
MENLEIEIKFHLENPRATRNAIIALGASSLGRVFETNHVLDNRGMALFQNRSLLRLRQAESAWLTFKAPPSAPDSEFKIRRELEMQVSDFITARKILEELGYTTVRIYEKWRETFELNDTHLCLDALPYGDFLEIEGAARNILKLSEKLGFAWEQRSVLNYHELFELVKAEHQLTFADITFSNFEGLSVAMRELKSRFEAGP